MYIMEEKNNSITLSDIWRVIKKNIILIGVITMSILLVGAIYTFKFTTPTYASSSSIVVAIEETASETDYSNSLRAVVTVADEVKSSKKLEPIANKYNMTVSQVASKISVSNNTNTMIVRIRVLDTDGERAINIANDVAQRCVEEAYKNSEDDKGLLFYVKDSIVIIDEASEYYYNSPNKLLYVIISFILGAVIALVVVFVKEFMSNKFKTKEDVEAFFDENIIGIIPDKKSNEKLEYASLVEPSIHEFEPYNKLISNIKYLNLDNPYKVIMTTSTIPSELKSTISANLAYTLYSNNKKVLIIDLDTRKPSINKIFKVQNENGLVEYVEGISDINSIIKKSDSGVDVITSGKNVINPIVIIESSKVKELLNKLREIYDYIIVDTPPTYSCTDASIISKLCDGVIFNVSINQVKKKYVKEAINSLKLVDANIIGINITKAQISKKDSAYYYYNVKPVENN